MMIERHLSQIEGLVGQQGNDADRHSVVHGLIQAVDAALGDKSLDIGVPQDICLRGPVHRPDVAAEAETLFCDIACSQWDVRGEGRA